MFERIGNTWELMGACWEVLKKEKGLIVFPLLSGIACLLVVGSFAVPFFMTGDFQSTQTNGVTSVNSRHAFEMQFTATHYVLLFAFYFCNYFVIAFFNTAIIVCAVQRLQGHDTNVAEGFRGAMARIHLIAGWALLSATVGMILKAIEDRSSWVGKIVTSLFGIAWTVASYLVVPVLVVENKGPFTALKESAMLLRKTWGEQIIGNFSFGAIFMILSLPAILVVVFAIAVTGGVGAGVIGIIVMAGLYLLVLSLVQSALSAIFQAAVYLYARGEESQALLGRGFPVQLLAGAMRTREPSTAF